MMTTCEWLGMRFEAPDDWEIVRHAVSEDQGRLVFVDRRRQRLSLSWLKLNGRPDVGRQLSDSLGRDREKQPRALFTEIERAGRWAGYRWVEEGVTTTRMGFFAAGLSRWIETVLIWPEGLDAGLERRILDSFEAHGKGGPGARLRAFGVDLTAPGGWQLRSASVLPADCTFGFENGKGSATVRRLKLAQETRSRGLDTLISDGRAPSTVHPARYRGHEGCRSEGWERAFALRWLWQGRRASRDLAWRCMATNSVYHVRVTADRTDPVKPEEFTIRCCDGEGQ